MTILNSSFVLSSCTSFLFYMNVVKKHIVLVMDNPKQFLNLYEHFKIIEHFLVGFHLLIFNFLSIIIWTNLYRSIERFSSYLTKLWFLYLQIEFVHHQWLLIFNIFFKHHISSISNISNISKNSLFLFFHLVSNS